MLPSPTNNTAGIMVKETWQHPNWAGRLCPDVSSNEGTGFLDQFLEKPKNLNFQFTPQIIFLDFFLNGILLHSKSLLYESALMALGMAPFLAASGLHLLQMFSYATFDLVQSGRSSVPRCQVIQPSLPDTRPAKKLVWLNWFCFCQSSPVINWLNYVRLMPFLNS